MKARTLWKVSVTTPSEAEEAVVELMGRLFRVPASSYADARKRTSVTTVFFDHRSGFSAADIAALKAGLAHIRACGLDIGTGRIALRKVRREDWAESWKKHFKPMAIGGALLIKPSWSRCRPGRGQAVVILDPGLSFGTGQHPTTRFCLEQIVSFRNPGQRQSFLDLGTGSGILAIAAARLGYCPVTAFDFDGAAVRVARENARQNSVLDQLALARRDLTRLPLDSRKKSHLICANLMFDLLVAGKSRIVNRLHPEGRLVLAGILHSQFQSVRRTYERAGLRLVASRREKEWRSGVFAFPK